MEKRMKQILSIMALTALFISLTVQAGLAAAVYYAKEAAAGTGDCTNWDDACTLATALGLVSSGDEIWAAAGTHIPGSARSDTFQLISGVGLYGGFTGMETARDQRDSDTNLTILSGDIDGDDSQNPITDSTTVTGNTNNSYHVVWADGTTTPVTGTTALDGFTITGGYADGSYPDFHGGGFYCDGTESGNVCSPALSNLTFSGNKASQNGGAMFNNGGNGTSSPSLSNVIFSNNTANSGGAISNDSTDGESNPVLVNVTFSGNIASGVGGAMFNDGSFGICNPGLTNVTFSGNTASGSGGAIFNESYEGLSSPILSNVTFSGNETGKSGGAMFNDGYDGESSPILSNVTFSGNVAAANGGAMINAGTNDGMVGVSSPTLVNVTFSGNTASGSGGAMYNLGDSGGTSAPSLSNVILWGNTAATGGAQMYNESGAPLINDSVVQGGCPADSSCTNVISEDPLLDVLTDFGGPGQEVYPLLSGSSAIDAGDDSNCPAEDQRGETRPQGNHCDIGAYEYTKAFSWSMFLRAILAPK